LKERFQKSIITPIIVFIILALVAVSAVLLGADRQVIFTSLSVIGIAVILLVIYNFAAHIGF
jgi:hypothetical protein